MRSSVIDSRRSPKGEGRDTRYDHVFPSQMPNSRHAPVKPVIHPPRRHPLLAPTEGWFAMLLLAVAVYCVAFSITSASWVSHSRVLLLSPAIGLVVGLFVAKVPKLPQVVLHLATCLLGHWLSIWLTSIVAFHVDWLLVLGSLRSVIVGGMSVAVVPNSEIVFFFYLSFLCFFLGYFGSWLIYRAHLPWLVALVYCSILLVNLNYVKEDRLYLVIILLGALLLLIARVQLTTQVIAWKREGLHTDSSWLRSITWRCMQVASVLTLLALLVSWALPMQVQSQDGRTFWDRLDNAWTNIVNGRVSLQNPDSITQLYQAPANFFGDQLPITGSVHLPTGEVLYYTSSAGPRYLEGFTYDHFDGHTWTSVLTSSNQQRFNGNTPLQQDVVRNDSTQVTTSVSIVQPPENTRHYIFGPAQPVSFDVSTIIYGNGTAVAWTQESALTPGERYKVISAVPPSDKQSLSTVPLPKDKPDLWNSDNNYEELTTYDLQVPHDLSPEVSNLARQWTSGATNTYSALKKLEGHLSDQNEFTYSVDNPPIPPNTDVADWLLQTHRGYCTYYASTMVMMARILGIPTRVVSGFSQGHLDAQHKEWIVQGDDAHSWVQAYLPNYGWISFDPTPGFAPGAAQGPQATPVATKPPTRPLPTATPIHHKAGPPSRKQNSGTHPTTSASTQGQLLVSQSMLLTLSAIILLGSLLVLLAAIGTYWWSNLFASSSFIAGTFWRFCYLASWIGLAPKKWQTPYEYSGTLSKHVPHKAGTLWHLTELYVRDRWGAPHQAPQIHEEDAQQLWPSLRGLLTSLVLKRIGKR